MNKVFFMGRLVADPEFSQSQTGTAICKFRIAVDRTYTRQGEEKKSDFFRITCFGKLAEHVSRYYTKGKPILVEGKIQNDNYTDNNGVQQYRDTIIADSVSFVLSDPTRSGNNQQSAPQNQQYGYNNGYQGNQGGYNQQYAPPAQNQQYQPPMQNYQQSAPAPQNQNDFSEFEQISDGQLPF